MSETEPEGWTAVSVGVDKYNVAYDGVIVFDLPRLAVSAVGYQLIERARLRRKNASLEQENASLRSCLRECADAINAFLTWENEEDRTTASPDEWLEQTERLAEPANVADALLAGKADPMREELARLRAIVGQFPRASDEVKKRSGWTIEPGFIRDIVRRIDNDPVMGDDVPNMEQVEAVLLNAEAARKEGGKRRPE